MEAIRTIGIGGILGMLVGIFFASWVSPTTVGGFGLLVIIFVGFGVLISAAIKLLVQRQWNDPPNIEPRASKRPVNRFALRRRSKPK